MILGCRLDSSACGGGTLLHDQQARLVAGGQKHRRGGGDVGRRGLDRDDEMSRGANRRHRRACRISSFDQLVGAEEEISTDRQSERFRRLEINDKLEFGGLLNRQVGRLLTLKNPSGVSACAPE